MIYLNKLLFLKYCLKYLQQNIKASLDRSRCNSPNTSQTEESSETERNISKTPSTIQVGSFNDNRLFKKFITLNSKIVI